MSSDKPISPDTQITVHYEEVEQACATLDALCVLLENYKDLKPVTQSKGTYADYTNDTIDAVNDAKKALLELIQATSTALRGDLEAFRLTDERLAQQNIHLGLSSTANY